MIYRCGCKQLIRMRSGCLLTGKDSRGAAYCWEHVNYLTLTISPACSSTSLSSTHQPPVDYLEMWQSNCVFFYNIYSFVLSPLHLLIESEPAFNSPCCTSSILFIPPSHLCVFLPCWAASSHIFALLINNRIALSQHPAFPPVLRASLLL